MPEAALRIDRLLWFLRLAVSRSFAQTWVATGHIRLGGQRVTRAAQPVRVGDVLTLPMRTGVCVIEILVLPVRRGPAAEAAACYRHLTPRTAESDSQYGEVIDGNALGDLGTTVKD
jgi:ribosome-associated heat shock protein Hsp15